MNLFIEPVKPKRISDQVFDQIKNLIYRGHLEPGEQLMPERELAQILDVSRTTVRGAIQRLIAKGLVFQVQGKGTFVTTQDRKMQSPLALAIKAQNASLENMYEIRLGLECTAAYLAALKADEADLNLLVDSFKILEKEHGANRRGSHADTSFHMAIAFASKNPLHIFIMRNIHDYLFHGIRENLESLYENRENLKNIMTQHEAILNAILSHEPDQAYDAMKDHIHFVSKMAQGAFKKTY